MEMDVGDSFNSVLGVCALVAFTDSSLFEAVKNDSTPTIEDLAGELEAETKSVEYLLLNLCSLGVVTIVGRRINRGTQFDSFYANKGFFVWLVKGYSEFLTQPNKLISKKNRAGDFYTRDDLAIAISSREIGSQFLDNQLIGLLESYRSSRIVDLGCGTGRRLKDISRSFETKELIGIDRSSKAIEWGGSQLQDEGAENIQLVCGDVTDLKIMDEFLHIDTAISVFMGHDLWPRDACSKFLRNLAEAFPKLRRLILCDMVRKDDWSHDRPMFSLAFETIHALMGHYIPTLQDWLEMLDDSEVFECSEVITSEIDQCVFIVMDRIEI